jgi:hypothetical protein
VLDPVRSEFARGLEAQLVQAHLEPSWKEINSIDHRFCSIIREVLDKPVFRRNQLAHAVSEKARNMFSVRILKYQGALGCVFSNQHQRLVSVRLSRERIHVDAHSVHHQKVVSYPPIVMQMHMAHLLRCMCVLQTWHKFKLTANRPRDIHKWARAVHQSYCTLMQAAQQMPSQ